MKPGITTLRSLAAVNAALCVAFALSAPAAAQPTYSIAAIGAANCAAHALNDRADVAGECDGTAVVWRNGIATSLGKLDGGNYSYAAAINSGGVVVGDGDTGNYRPQSWVTTARGLQNIFPNNGGNTHAVFIADTGFIGGFYTKSLSGWVSSWKGAIWTPDPKDPRKYRTTDLPVLPGGVDPKLSVSIPSAFNQLGQAAGYAQTDAIGQHAVFWNANAAHSIQDLGTLPGDWSSLAWGINDLGQVVGESHPPFSSRPTLWNNDPARTPVALPLLAGDNYGSASAINNLGHVIGYSAFATPGTWNVGPARAVIWRDGGVFDLESVLDSSTAAGWTVIAASAINNRGQIVGHGTLNGEVRIFLLTSLGQ